MDRKSSRKSFMRSDRVKQRKRPRNRYEVPEEESRTITHTHLALAIQWRSAKASPLVTVRFEGGTTISGAISDSSEFPSGITITLIIAALPDFTDTTLSPVSSNEPISA
ncbi:hypothetical protein J437_LFUL007939 [Ladona fulva]|uniref:Uncharacterized protein n=1 Tax=Ladona fulva TaxID=123851 RepID=A0A8K0KBL8_LADFU|nr:hypothetical protein J437_LFUL007939 [Ladona fulva]